MRKLFLFLTLLVFTFAGSQAKADSDLSKDKLLEYMTLSANKWGIPRELIIAIAKTESGINPWAININGKGFYFRDRDAAMTLIKNASRGKKSFDTGIMQLNNFTLSRLGIRPETALDPYINILIGGWLIANELRRFGYSWEAIGSYHTPVKKNPKRAKAYAQKVILNLRGL